MVQSNKILTVSYGTFSCTLEGFDDAFGTMKAIAEYFRDLAAEDRYFGAEPPQPDADMLAHIAQKEIARRVEAHRDENGFVLRAEEPAAAPVAAVAAAATADAVDELVEVQSRAPETSAEPSDEDVQAADIASPVIEEIAEEPDSASVEPAGEAEVDEADDAVIAEVSEEIAEQESAPVADEDDPVDEAADDAAEIAEVEIADAAGIEDDGAEDAAEISSHTADEAESDAEDIAAMAEDVADEAEADSDEAEVEADAELADEAHIEEDQAETAEAIEGEAAPDAVAAFFADTKDDASVYDDDTVEEDMVAPDVVAEEVEEAPARMSAAESIAAKLQRIRAVVSRRSTPEADQEFIEDEHADTPASGALDSLDDMDANEEELIAPPMTAEADEMAEPLDALEPAEIDSIDDDLDEAVAEEGLDETSDDADALEAGDTLSALLSEEVDAIETSDAGEDIAPSEEEIAQAQAQVVKVTREEFDAILAADRDEAEAAEAAEHDGALSDEDEVDLLRELAEVEAELVGDEPAEDIAADDVEAVSEGEERLEDDEIASIFAEADDDQTAELSDDADHDADVTRLLEEAGDKLEDDAASDRRSEFAHLRAAMAAGKAEEAAGGSMSEAASDGAYREDLARVVRPRRPESTEPRERTTRPQDEKPAPLKLVAAQRVDAEMAPVQPRRVMSVPIDDVVEESDEGRMKFADYAESLGAVELPDLLEAAASYLSFVEGQEQFSRPQLMTKVRMVEKEDFSREDGLRSFGLLLRDGKIEKTQAGRFTVSDRIGFRPDDTREAG